MRVTMDFSSRSLSRARSLSLSLALSLSRSLALSLYRSLALSLSRSVFVSTSTHYCLSKRVRVLMCVPGCVRAQRCVCTFSLVSARLV